MELILVIISILQFNTKATLITFYLRNDFSFLFIFSTSIINILFEVRSIPTTRDGAIYVQIIVFILLNFHFCKRKKKFKRIFNSVNKKQTL